MHLYYYEYRYQKKNLIQMCTVTYLTKRESLFHTTPVMSGYLIFMVNPYFTSHLLSLITLSNLSTAEQAPLNLSSGTPHAANIPSRTFLWFIWRKPKKG